MYSWVVLVVPLDDGGTAAIVHYIWFELSMKDYLLSMPLLTVTLSVKL